MKSDVKGFEGLYCIEDTGRVWSYISLKWLKPTPLSKSKHLYVSLRKDNKTYKKYIHRLVLETFVGGCQEGMECCHKDGNTFNNDKSNLYWGTRSNNIQDSIRHGTHGCYKKLTPEQVVRIKELIKDGHTQRFIGKLFNVDKSTIGYIKRGFTWKDIL